MTQDMTVDEALLVADQYGNYSTSSTPGVRALVLLAVEVRRQHAEIESFCMEYRMKCDAETKAQAVEIERLEKYATHCNELIAAYKEVGDKDAAEIDRLRSQLDASRRDAERAAGTASKLADQRLVAMADAEAESQKWLDKVINPEVESNRVMTVAQETRLRDFIDATVGVKP